MAGEYLPPVITRLTGDISDLMAKIATVKAAMKDLNGAGTLTVNVQGFEALHETLGMIGQDIAHIANVSDSHGGVFPSMATGAAVAATGFRVLGTGIRLTGAAIHWITAGTFEFLAVFIPAMIALASGMFVAMQGADNVIQHMQAMYGATEATAQAFHQTMGTLLGLKPAFQQAQDAANPGVYELLGSYVNAAKVGFLNLAGAGLQTVHMLDEFAARVNVDLAGGTGAQLHDLLGSMVTDLSGLGQIVANVGHALLNLASAMPGLVNFLLAIAVGISKVVLWVTQLNPLLITIGMGLEEFWRWGGLVATVIGLIARAIVALPTAAFTLFMNAVGSAGRIMGSLFSAGGLLAAGLGKIGQVMQGLIGIGGRFSTAMYGAGAALETMAQDLMLMRTLGVGLGVFITLAILLGHIKDQAQQVAANVTKAVDAAQGLQVFAQAGIGLNKLNMAMIQANTQMSKFSPSVQAAGTYIAAFQAQGVNPLLSGMSKLIQISGSAGAAMTNWGKNMGSIAGPIVSLWGRVFSTFGGATKAASDLQVLNTAEAQLVTQAAIVGHNLMFLGGAFHTTAVGAAYLAQAAGVNLSAPLIKGSEAAKIATQQIQNLEKGIGAMGAPMGVVGNDMTALGIQSQLTASKVSQLNQAWDAWIASVTATASDMSQVQTALLGMSHAALNTSSSVTGSVGNISTAIKGSTYTLKGFGTAAMQSWQQFAGAVTSGNSALDQLRIGMAEGVVSGNQFISTTKAMVGEMLPFTQGNAAAVKMLSQLAHEAGGPTTSSLKTLATWAGITGKAARDQFVKGMLAATNAMGNMSKVAQNLSSVLNGQMDAALAAAILKFSGVNTAIQTYVKDVANSHTPQSQLQADLSNISSALLKENGMMSTVSKGWNSAQQQASGLTGQVHALGLALDSLHSRDITVRINTINDVFTQHSTIGPSQHASGTQSAEPGWSWVGEHGPELMYMRGGEQVVPNYQASSKAAALGGGSDQVEERQPIIITLDGQVIYRAVETRVYRKNFQNGMRNTHGGAQGRFGVR